MNPDLSATTIQKLWKGSRVRRIETPQRIEELKLQKEQIRIHEASITIQSFFKIVLAKSKASELRRLKEEQERLRLRTNACLLIQSILRYQQSRRFEFSVKRFTPVAAIHQLVIATRVRGFLARLKHGDIRTAFERYNGRRRLDDAAAVIQALIRGVLTRDRLERDGLGGLLVENRVQEGAVIFQRVCRGFLDRQRLFLMFIGDESTSSNNTATNSDDPQQNQQMTTTTNVNNMATFPSLSTLTTTGNSQQQQEVTGEETDGEEIDEEKEQDVPIGDEGPFELAQTLSPMSSFNPFASSSSMSKSKSNKNNTSDLLSSSIKSPIAFSKFLKKVVLCQATARRFMEKNTIFNLKMERINAASIQLRTGCAVIIQKFWRGYLQKQKFRTDILRYRAGVILHSVVSAYLVRAYDLAAMHHVKLVREHVALEHKSATMIASIVRMFFAKKYVWGMNKLVLRIQRVSRANKARMYLKKLLRERSAIRIQRQTRKFLKQKRERLRYGMLRESLAAQQERDLAAVLIQSLARQFLSRIAYVRMQRLSRLEMIRMRRAARKMMVNYDDRKRFREARENMLAKRVQQRWFGYTTQIRENFEILRLEAKLEGINIKAATNLERAHRSVVEEEYEAWSMDFFAKFQEFNTKLKALLDRLHFWHNEGQYVPSQMLRLYEAQRFARGAAARKKYKRESSSTSSTQYSPDRNKIAASASVSASALLVSPRLHQDATSSRHLTSSLMMMKEQHSISKVTKGDMSRISLPHLLPGEGNNSNNNNNNNNTDDDDKTANGNSTPSLSPIRNKYDDYNDENDISNLANNFSSGFIEQQVSAAASASTLPLERREYVDLSYTYLSLPVMQKYFISLRYSTVVKYLDASHCSLGDDTASYLIEICSGMDNIEVLNLSHNPITDVVATKLISWLETSGDLMKEINVSNTLMSKRYQKVVAAMLKKPDYSDLDMLRRRVMAIELQDDD